MIWIRFFAACLRQLWMLVALLIILYAVVVVLGREFLPVVDRYQAQINDYVSAQTGLGFSAEGLGGEWAHLTPVLKSGAITIRGASGDPFLAISDISAEVDLPASLANMELLWRQLRAESVELIAREQADGSWSIGGLPLRGGDSSGLDSLIDVLFFSSHIEVGRFVLSLEFYSGARNSIYGRDILVENQSNFHRATASVALEDSEEDLASMVLEGTGNPHRLDKFLGKGYLRLNQVNFSGSLSTLVHSWLPQMAERVGEIDTELDAELWLQTRQGKGLEITGHVAAAEIPLNWTVDLPPLRNFHTDITGWYTYGEDWGLRFQNLDADWANEEIQPLNARLSQRVGDRWTEFSLGVDHLNLEILRGLLGSAGILGDTLTSLLSTLNPRGDLNNVDLALDIDPENPDFRFRANLHEVAIDSFRGAPSARGVSGYVEARAHQGFVELDSAAGFAMHYPQAYNEFIEHDQARGRVDWRVDPGKVTVQSGPIAITNAHGQGKAYLNLGLPLDDSGEPDMTLVVGMRDSNTRYLHHYLPDILPASLLRWLDGAIGVGEIAEAGFIWRGSLAADSPDKRTIQVYARAEHLDFAFQEGWLPLRDASASLVVDDINTDVTVHSGRLGEGKLQSATVKLLESAPGGDLVLGVEGELTADVGEAMAIMRQSPLRDRVGLPEDWQLSGDSRVKVDLRIPFAESDAGTEAYNVAVDLANTRLVLGDTNLAVEAVNGTLGFDLQKGLHGQALKGRFLGGVVSADIATDDGNVQIDIDGQIAMSGLDSYLGSLQSRISGQADYQGTISIPAEAGKSPSLKVSSRLEGIAIDLPAPLAKAAADPWPSETRMQFFKDAIDIEGVLAGRHGVHIVLGRNPALRGTVGINTTQAHLVRNPGLLVRGRLEHLDTAEWQPLFTGAEGASADTDGPGALETLQPQLDLRIADLTVNDISLGNTRLKGSHQERSWRFDLESPLLAGDVYLADDGSIPTRLRLDYLRLPAIAGNDAAPAADSASAEGSAPAAVAEAGSGQAQEPGLLDALDPRTLPELDFATEELSLGEQNYGRLAFVSEKQDDGILIRNLNGEIRGVVFGEQQEEHPTLLQWVTDGENHQTYISATLRTDNIGTVLETWGAPKLVDSKKAAFSVDVSWQDKPWSPKAAGLLGYVGLNMEKGYFYKSPGGATNALIKIVGLFNFDTWLRRLRFDFSDFFSSGVSYDQIRGGIAFEDGFMSFDDPLQTDMPSGKIRFLGRADMVNELLDARLVATMPIGTNLPWVAALVGGLPAAAGVFITSKLFKKEVDKLSSISYRVTGSWDDPELKVDRIFSDKTDYEPSERMAPLVEPIEPDALPGSPPPENGADPEDSSPATED